MNNWLPRRTAAFEHIEGIEIVLTDTTLYEFATGGIIRRIGSWGGKLKRLEAIVDGNVDGQFDRSLLLMKDLEVCATCAISEIVKERSRWKAWERRKQQMKLVWQADEGNHLGLADPKAWW